MRCLRVGAAPIAKTRRLIDARTRIAEQEQPQVRAPTVAYACARACGPRLRTAAQRLCGTSACMMRWSARGGALPPRQAAASCTSSFPCCGCSARRTVATSTLEACTLCWSHSAPTPAARFGGRVRVTSIVAQLTFACLPHVCCSKLARRQPTMGEPFVHLGIKKAAAEGAHQPRFFPLVISRHSHLRMHAADSL